MFSCMCGYIAASVQELLDHSQWCTIKMSDTLATLLFQDPYPASRKTTPELEVR